MLVDEPRCFWQLIFSETEDNAKFFLCPGETLSLCVFLRHSRGSSDFRKTQCRWGTLIHYFLSEDGRCDASSARLSRVWCSVGLLLQVLPVWRLAIPLPAVLMITVSLYMIVLGIGLWIRYCLKVGALFMLLTDQKTKKWFPVRYLPLVWPLQGPVFALWAVFYPLCCQLWTYNKILCWIHAGIGKYTWNVYIVKLAVIILQLMNTFMSQ